MPMRRRKSMAAGRSGTVSKQETVPELPMEQSHHIADTHRFLTELAMQDRRSIADDDEFHAGVGNRSDGPTDRSAAGHHGSIAVPCRWKHRILMVAFRRHGIDRLLAATGLGGDVDVVDYHPLSCWWLVEHRVLPPDTHAIWGDFQKLRLSPVVGVFGADPPGLSQ